MFDERARYIIKDYQNKPAFSSFLPGIAGPMGVPVWCYYNNRGQAVCSFGARDKDHAVMEFSPAYCAYRDVERRGFRTFIKVNGEYREPFARRGADSVQEMHIGRAELEIVAKSGEIEAYALYFGLPGERTAALIRVLTVRNISASPVKVEILDGMPEIVPFGINQDTLKNMTQLATAWMRTEDEYKGIACFRLRASMEDTARVTEVKGCNFCLGWNGSGELLHPIVDQRLVFGEDTSLSLPETFVNTNISTLTEKKQTTENAFPCCFLPEKTVIEAGGEIKIYSIYGQTEDKETVEALSEKVTGPEWFEEKRRETEGLADALTSAVCTKTADPVFDGYCRQTYLDNLLRGGVPYFFEDNGKRVPFYLYSRKHGDPEREYNYFSLGGEYFAQGNGNFRDVNQNRRCDVLFAPELGDTNIRTFYELIQPDGYNPLVLTAEKYSLPREAVDGMLEKVPQKHREAASKLMSESFTPGAVAMEAEKWGFSKEEAMSFATDLVCSSNSELEADFSEGYWCDHWTYNLDLIESYLSVYPERERELIFGNADYRWYAPRAKVNPRARRYRMTEKGLRQYNALTELQEPDRKWATVSDGTEARSPLIEKLLLLCSVKTATLDAAGMGIEMEGGKPGWYDALNGLPGLLGSSMAETCELLRLVRFTSGVLERYGEDVGDIGLYDEIAELIEGVTRIIGGTDGAFARWDKLNILKERYREKTAKGFNGSRKSISPNKLTAALSVIEKALEGGIKKAAEYGNGIMPTYFTYETDEITDTPEGPMPKKLTPEPLPAFLEGPVHLLKLPLTLEEKKAVTDRIRNSGLYDKELKMYKVNDNLGRVSFEAGRAKAFSRGWLENESVWLHMEYKYLLELLKSGLYEEFSEAFRSAAVPFTDAERYGRSPLENVSFIVSSANPDSSRWGRGYTARLSGSTAEFLEIWQKMFFGKQPFSMTEEGLNLKFTPFIPEYLIPSEGKVCATFLGKIPVTYRITSCRPHTEIFEAERWMLTFYDGTKSFIEGDSLPDAEARKVRNGLVKEMYIILK